MIRILITTALAINSAGLFQANTQELVNTNSISESLSNAIELIERLEGKQLMIEETFALYVTDYMPSLCLISFDPIGYAIVVEESGKVLQYDVNHSSPIKETVGKIPVYAGPYNCLYLSKDELEEHRGLNLSQELKEINHNAIHAAIDRSMTSYSWQGNITSAQMQRYSGSGSSSDMWINNTNNYPAPYPSRGICGTIASAGMLAYYDDYVNNDYVPAAIRTQNSLSPGSLISTLYNYIDAGLLIGTFPYNLESGIDAFISYHSVSPYLSDSIYGWGNGGTTAKNKILAERPVCVSTLSEPAYGNHWLLAYKYSSNSDGDFYRCVDNHGSYTAVISMSYVTSYVYINC